ncbi:carboxypepD_reg-like domain-containing protein [Elysia marginata]|uniref:CarboxypepD_reg-like domain-containing protein n=1 Tax=Elysia marginata TaxID=1093978 RepID=A0AAV4G6Z4_9GAST|nr:carboxypepD_reg-like domain-containing protein [Elysia marginata]
MIAQRREQYIEGKVLNARTRTFIPNVYVINLTSVSGTTTDQTGTFKIQSKVRDKLYFSFLGFKPIKVEVTNDMIKYRGTEVALTELAYALETDVATLYSFTGFLDIDARNTPITVGRRYNISGLPNRSYEVGDYSPGAVTKMLGGLFGVDNSLYSVFRRKAEKMKKLRLMRKNTDIKAFLSSKYDRNMILEFLGISIYDLEAILKNCNYSNLFIKKANDLQVLEAVSTCYDNFNILNRYN